MSQTVSPSIMPPIPTEKEAEKVKKINKNDISEEEKKSSEPFAASLANTISHSLNNNAMNQGPQTKPPPLQHQLLESHQTSSQDRNSSAIENRFAVGSKTQPSFGDVNNDSRNDSQVDNSNEESDESGWIERNPERNSVLIQKMTSLKVVVRSNSGHHPSKKGSSSKGAGRPVLSLKPPRLDTKKIAIIAAHKTPDFSPLSANAMNRAQLFLELCSSFHDARYLPLWYREWMTFKEASQIRASTARTFELLQSLEFERQQTEFYSMKDSHSGSNAPLNRYADVAPYDHCRVYLNSKKSNYINASFVSSLDEKKRYIATQGPLPSTFGDFWSMVWEQNSVVIVMLSKEEESCRLKCHRYWPDKVGDTKRYFKMEEMNSICFKVWYSEDLVISEGSTIIRELIITREQVIQDKNSSYIPESRMIRIVFFSGWNDHDSCDPRQLISLVDIANEVNSPEMNILPSGDPFPVGPMVIHCSAGIGRTGTFCTADTMFHYLSQSDSPLSINNLLKDNADAKKLPEHDFIANTVNKFRKQRPGFVQTSAQYHLLYEIVLLRLNDLFHGSIPVNWETTLLQKEDQYRAPQ